MVSVADRTREPVAGRPPAGATARPGATLRPGRPGSQGWPSEGLMSEVGGGLLTGAETAPRHLNQRSTGPGRQLAGWADARRGRARGFPVTACWLARSPARRD
jgi:hypothetical protein